MIVRRIHRDPLESHILLKLAVPDTMDTGSTDLLRYLSHPMSEPSGVELTSMRPPVRLDIWLRDPLRRQDPAFKDFESGLRFFLHEEYYEEDRTRELVQTRGLQSITITPFGILKAWYTSLEDFRRDVDRLVVQPSFHGRSREDSVIVRGTSDDDLWFYRLLAVFTIVVDKTPLEIAYGRPYKVTGRDPYNQSLLATLVGPADADFFWVRSIIRGVHTYSGSDKKKNMFVINDLIDADALFRLKHLKPVDDICYWDALETATRAEDARLEKERLEELAQTLKDREYAAARKKAAAAARRQKKAKAREKAKNGDVSSDEEEEGEVVVDKAVELEYDEAEKTLEEQLAESLERTRIEEGEAL
ncbi:hypothetical protein P7C70_g8942, partial [Phenoliferia sp. Uapishka_3]